MIDQAQKLREQFAAFEKQEHVPEPANRIKTGCRSVAITSGKGGVGKSNICLSLAISLAALKKKVLIFDADLGLANVHILCGMSPKKTLYHYINKECTLAELIVQGPGGVQLLSGSSGIEAMANMDAMQLGLLTRELSGLEAAYDYMLIDTGAGIGHITTGFTAMADRAILVVTPEPTSLADAYAMVKVLFRNSSQRLSVLVNMAQSQADAKETFDKLAALVVKFLNRPVENMGFIPYDKQVGVCVRRQSVLSLVSPRALFSTQIMQCARMLCGMPPASRGGFFGRLFQK